MQSRVGLNISNIESGESLSTLVEGNDRIRLKVSCDIG